MRLARRNMPLNALRAFEAAAKHCHLGRAAQELGVTQGAISQQVRSLEDFLSTTLFQRISNRLQLTSAGKRLYHSVSQGLDVIMEGVLQLDPEIMSGELTICSTPSITNSLLVPIIGRYNEKYPEVTIKLEQILPSTTEFSNDMDIIICYGKPSNKEQVIRKLYDTSFFPVASPSLFQHAQRPKSVTQLLDFPLIHDQLNSWTDWLHAVNSRQTISKKSNIYYKDTYQAILAATKGQGIVLAERYEIADELSSGRLIRLLKHSVNLPAGGYLVLPPIAQQTQRAKIFVDLIDLTLQGFQDYFRPDNG